MDLKLLPTDEELVKDDSSFFPNIIKGEYPDVSAYLDIHYSLLREDFIRPLREALAAFKKNPGKKVENLAIFPSIRFKQIQKVSHEIGIEVQFTENDCEDEDWENSKSLLKGSLLLFTSDNFQSHMLGTVLQREIMQLKRGVVTVRIHRESPFLLEFTAPFLMAECDTFFLPYCNVMNVLGSLQENTFPFRSEIVYAHKDSFAPEYLHDLTEYSLPNGKSVTLLQMRTAVKPEELALNESQFSAVVTALQRRIALVQGPPGTGKTYVGSKIAEILLKNDHVWNVNNDSPLLIVCASNQALDQFAERLLPFTEDIIRIGEQSKSKLLENFNLNVIQRRNKLADFDKSQQTQEMKTRYKNMMVSWDNLEKIVERINRIRDDGGDVVHLIPSLRKLETDYNGAVELFKKEQQKTLEHILRKAKVLAMTTTRAASMHDILKKVKPPIGKDKNVNVSSLFKI